MKIEKINDSQIRCTLTSQDLESRKIRLSELAYGSDKAKSLFQDMMQQAQSRFGFDAGTSPIMIEAIPLSSDTIVLIITKVDDPEELDTRFSRFSPSDSEDSKNAFKKLTGADDILDLFQKIHESHSKKAQPQEEAPSGEKTDADPESGKKAETKQSARASKSAPAKNLIRAFRFSGLETVMEGVRALHGCYTGKNSLLKIPDGFLLILHQSANSASDFNKVSNILTEYGIPEHFSSALEAHFTEHGDFVIKKNAVQTLEQL